MNDQFDYIDGLLDRLRGQLEIANRIPMRDYIRYRKQEHRMFFHERLTPAQQRWVDRFERRVRRVVEDGGPYRIEPDVKQLSLLESLGGTDG